MNVRSAVNLLVSSGPSAANVSIGETVTVTDTPSFPDVETIHVTDTPTVTVLNPTKAAQTISFSALSAKVYGTAPFTVSATASSGLTVRSASTTTLVCTVLGVTVTLVAAGTCTIQATQAGNTNYAAATPVSQSFQVNALQGSGINSTTAVNLTAVGGADWVHFGDYNRKAGVTPQLSYPQTGYTYYGDPRSMSWTDGTSNAAYLTNAAGLRSDTAGIGQLFTFSATADLTVRTLLVYVGGTNSAGTLTAHLSDGSAPDFTDTPQAMSGKYDRTYTLTYKAGSVGQKLTITWQMASGKGQHRAGGRNPRHQYRCECRNATDHEREHAVPNTVAGNGQRQWRQSDGRSDGDLHGSCNGRQWDVQRRDYGKQHDPSRRRGDCSSADRQ